ncbi:MAG: hypothetical protein KDN19_08685 [Verrucomicrobiae bacterium]|nr:hypothetical protein [Verrucomicrobiae bacterium]
MKARKILQILAVLVLLLWGGTFVTFYATGRIENHVDKRFRTWALVAGMGLCVVGLFNFATMKRREVCTHDHGDGDGDGCCGHDHDHKHGHEHHHDCGHDHHHHHEHDHGHACCGHDHDHQEHGHELHDHELHDHEQPTSAILTAVIVLTIPLLMAARFSKDSFSSEYLQKWGKIEREIQQLRLAEKRAAKAKANAAGQQTVAAASTPPSKTSPEASAAADAPPGAEATPAAQNTAADTPPSGADSSGDGGAEWGSFTMADLERMVPKNSEGKFLLDVPQIFYTAGDEELMHVMEGIPVETVAQVMEETQHNPNGNRLKLFRLFIECCAADARPLSIPIEFGAKPPAHEELGWVKVTGKIHYSEEEGDIIPLIQVDSMVPTPEPSEAMMY